MQAARRDALRRNPDYSTYIASLRTVGYFQEKVEGSQAWNAREDKAASVFIESRRDEWVPSVVHQARHG
jgi:hypothetical protein